MDNKELYRIHADFCKFMANAKRIEIIFLLGEKEMCVDELASAMEVNVPNISQHLAVMREAMVEQMTKQMKKIKSTIALAIQRLYRLVY